MTGTLQIRVRHWVAALLCTFTVQVFAADSSLVEPSLLEPSGQEAWIPAPGTPFSTYVSTNEARIRAVLQQYHYSGQAEPFGPTYPLERAVQMRAPYELLPQPGQCDTGGRGTRIGFLLIHGLTDSPYLLRAIANSLQEQFPCAISRGLLLPGHGTVPGDSLKMRHEDWIAVTEYGVESFRGQVDALYMVGFSTGTSLSVTYVDQHRDDGMIKGLIMLSPALQARNGSAFLAQYLRWFSDWLDAEAEHDAARYESFSVNAGAEFHQLTRDLSDEDFAPLTVPVFMAGSGDDATVSIEAARAFFCSKAPLQQRRFLWYAAEATGSTPSRTCEGLQVIAAESPAQRVVSQSHVGITLPASDPHYGVDGAYSVCLHYGFGSADFDTCTNDDAQTVYGERNLGIDRRHDGKLIRRTSFNPHYESMLEEIVCFIDGTC